MLNEQLTCLTPFSQEDEPGLAWRTEEHEENLNAKTPSWSSCPSWLDPISVHYFDNHYKSLVFS